MPKLTLSFKGRPLSVHVLGDQPLTVGRDPDCDIPIDSLAVAPCHARFGLDEQGYFVHALDSQFPLRVNNELVEHCWLDHGDLLQIGKHTLVFAADAYSLVPEALERLEAPTEPLEAMPDPSPSEPLTSPPAGAAFLQVQSGEHLGRVIPLNRNLVRIGKAGGNCIMIAQRHNGHYLTYLEGTMVRVDGIPVGTETLKLVDGQRIQLGSIQFQFYVEPLHFHGVHRNNP